MTSMRPPRRSTLAFGLLLGASVLAAPSAALAQASTNEQEAAMQDLANVLLFGLKMEHQSLIEQCDKRGAKAAPKAKSNYAAWLERNKDRLRIGETLAIKDMAKSGTSVDKEMRSTRERHEKGFSDTRTSSRRCAMPGCRRSAPEIGARAPPAT